MLQLLKETVTSRHAERLEQIVIALIAVEIGACARLRGPRLRCERSRSRRADCADFAFDRAVLGIITIIVDLFS